ncbi:hypothetical protein COT75_00210 [Candidatus Beckwithbacteria bacterium CG10_big_fil_rev_8_21_14_0_10_34_10]|uniref:Bacterial bifunctional deaminase-reductase C-terminal domain-containing protein n=1 Tax=Candidatus Beckwithbacteria bacterium CG10_big_fil_rev_8_21_14_0_10_34_10 TaxID=1974495 RepID=A0A2H0WAD5_9BACT|nr:MAG: hypothetical protein COT75_00210 [Candidatus Beckwithbacteria bacterium CG10_big_fil_rev_8_21_14_0_10_34_10]
MKVILYMATSINGLITKGQDDSDWVTETDWKEFDALIRDCGIMVMGRKTYEIFGDDFPCKGAINIVMTSNKKLLNQKTPSNVIFTNKTPKEVIVMAGNKGLKKLMLIGGMTLNTSFLKENLVNEIWLSIHPFLIGNGLRVMDKFDCFKRLKRIGIKELGEGLIQIRYRVNK